MRLLAIFGSPRKNGYSSRIHEEIIIPFAERGFIIDRVYAYESDVEPCTGCAYCRDHNSCSIDDGMTGIYSLIKDADVISISSPLYFSSLPSPLKAIIDRCQLLWEECGANPGLKNGTKKGVFICAGGSEYSEMFAGAIQCMRHFFNAINVSFKPEDSLLYPNSDSSPEISLEFLEKARMLGKAYSEG